MTPERYRQVRDLADAAWSRPEGERQAFLAGACAGDEALRAEVSSLLDADHELQGSSFLEHAAAMADEPTGGAAAEAVAIEPLPAGGRLGAYEIVESIGQGGMGAVYRAVRADGTYRQVVAVKVIRRGMETPAAQRRFREERQILAALEHPGIARLLDGGTTEAGLPYLVMEHVPGEPIDAYCDGRRLGVPERLRLFLKVCEAVHHAHRSLVVHRDLKPGNILVTPDGTPKLLDFGIARLLQPAGASSLRDATVTAVRALTPDYSSPEQVRGEVVTTSTDVYSLGVVLYELLTGVRPHEASLMHEVLAAICHDDPGRPSASVARTRTRTRAGVTEEITPEAVSRARGLSPGLLRRRLSGDLDTIVLKALRKAPAERYASAEALAEDVRRYLDGRPVRARPQTAAYRAGRFVRRNPAVVTAFALAVAALLGGIVATARQARIAERRFTDVRRIANSFLFEFEAAIRDLPGSTPARQLVVKKAQEYLDGLAREGGDDPALLAELATAYQRVGDLQGNPYGPNLGDTPGAMASIRKEVAIRESLAHRRENDRSATRELAGAYRRLGLLEDEAGQTHAGVEHLDRALALADGVVAGDPQDEAARRLLAEAHDAAGLLALKTGNHAAAEEHQRKGLDLWEAERRMRPDDPAPLRGLFVLNGDLARTLRVTGRQAESVDHYRRSLAAAEARVRMAPQDATARREESVAEGNLAVGLYREKQLDEARSLIGRSLAFDEEMLRADPKNSAVQRDVSWDLGFLAELATQEGKLEEALTYQRRALAMDEARAAAAPGSFQARKDVAESWSSVSDLLHRMRRLEEALDASRRSVEAFEELARGNPGQERVQQLMGAGYGRQGELLEARAGDRGVDGARLRREACRAYARSLEVWDALAARKASIDAEYGPLAARMREATARCAGAPGGE